MYGLSLGTLKPYSCPVCFTSFSRKYHLVRHNMQTGCDGSEKPKFPCQVSLIYLYIMINLTYYKLILRFVAKFLTERII